MWNRTLWSSLRSQIMSKYRTVENYVIVDSKPEEHISNINSNACFVYLAAPVWKKCWEICQTQALTVHEQNGVQIFFSLSLHSFYHYKQNFSVQFSGYSNAASAFNRKISRRGICGFSYWNLTDNKENRRTEKTSTKVQKELCTTDCRSVSRLFILKIENNKPKMS